MGDDGWTTSANTLGAQLPSEPGRSHTLPVVIDARGMMGELRAHIPGSIHMSWLRHRDGRGRTGKLTSDIAALRADLAAHGIDETRQVVVYGDGANGWGEEGRIAWMLRYLGVERVRVLDGGVGAWRRAGGRITHRLSSHAGQGHSDARHTHQPLWSARLRSDLRASVDDVQQAVDDAAKRVQLVDTRSMAEWNGSRRYWPERVGRIPGAMHLEWKSLLADDGLLDRSAAALSRLARAGLTPERPVIAYCVGGVRSAHTCIALRALGFSDVRNYDGSWYEWAADRTRPIESPPCPR